MLEIIDFFPNKSFHSKKKRKLGSLHVYLTDLDIDIRGCPVMYKDGRLWIAFPHMSGQTHDEGKKVFFPVFTFSNEEKMRGLLAELRERAYRFILEWYGENQEALQMAVKAGMRLREPPKPKRTAKEKTKNAKEGNAI